MCFAGEEKTKKEVKSGMRTFPALPPEGQRLKTTILP